jgi:hypothetical protein
MILLEVLRNGKLITRAGRADLGVLHAIVGGDAGGNESKRPGHDLNVHVGGMTSKRSGLDEHLTWVGHMELTIGDEITVRIVESAEADAPRKQKPVDEATRIQRRREAYENCKNYYLEHRAEYEPNVE